MPRRPMSAPHISEMMEQLSLASIMRVIPQHRVKDALAATGTASQRNRLLPAPLVAYLVLMLSFYAEVSVRENLSILLEHLRALFGRDTARLITTLLDPSQAPADELAQLYTQRWTEETSFDELKTHLRGPHRVLRSPLPDLVEQEWYGFLLAYYVVRVTLVEAARREGCAPRTFSFVRAVRVIKRKLAFSPSDRPGNEADV